MNDQDLENLKARKLVSSEDEDNSKKKKVGQYVVVDIGVGVSGVGAAGVRGSGAYVVVTGGDTMVVGTIVGVSISSEVVPVITPIVGETTAENEE